MIALLLAAAVAMAQEVDLAGRVCMAPADAHLLLTRSTALTTCEAETAAAVAREGVARADGYALARRLELVETQLRAARAGERRAVVVGVATGAVVGAIVTATATAAVR